MNVINVNGEKVKMIKGENMLVCCKDAWSFIEADVLQKWVFRNLWTQI